MDLEYQDQGTRDAEREFDAATTRTALSAAAKKQMRAKQELKRLEGAWTGRRDSAESNADDPRTPPRG